MKLGDYVIFIPDEVERLFQYFPEVPLHKTYQIQRITRSMNAGAIYDIGFGEWNEAWFMNANNLSLLERAIYGITE